MKLQLKIMLMIAVVVGLFTIATIASNVGVSQMASAMDDLQALQEEIDLLDEFTLLTYKLTLLCATSL